MASPLTFAIGDIHGCFDKMRSLLDVCETLADGRDAKFIFIGDYIDRGPDAQQVLDFLIHEQSRPNRRFVCLCGNHEDMLIRAAHQHRSVRDLLTWWGNGGGRTLDSYGVDDPFDLPAPHLNWIRSLPLMESEPGRLYVHAGIRPGVPLPSQSREDLLWIREPFLSSEDDHGVLIVHGHTPTLSDEPELRPNRLNLDTGACFGGPLTAAVFSNDEVEPKMFLNHAGEIQPALRR
ncbi:serine/threonine protein phosphatase 1 [Nitrobacteraceae bacterium AZCC 1564]